jgi:hypothetical protein
MPRACGGDHRHSHVKARTAATVVRAFVVGAFAGGEPTPALGEPDLPGSQAPGSSRTRLLAKAFRTSPVLRAATTFE